MKITATLEYAGQEGKVGIQAAEESLGGRSSASYYPNYSSVKYALKRALENITKDTCEHRDPSDLGRCMDVVIDAAAKCGYANLCMQLQELRYRLPEETIQKEQGIIVRGI